jgi:DNA-directed RNA polymerase specialized sigma subunit
LACSTSDIATTVGLIKAVDRYDDSLGVDFTGYAIPAIVGELALTPRPEETPQV